MAGRHFSEDHRSHHHTTARPTAPRAARVGCGWVSWIAVAADWRFIGRVTPLPPALVVLCLPICLARFCFFLWTASTAPLSRARLVLVGCGFRWLLAATSHCQWIDRVASLLWLPACLAALHQRCSVGLARSSFPPFSTCGIVVLAAAWEAPTLLSLWL